MPLWRRVKAVRQSDCMPKGGLSARMPITRNRCPSSPSSWKASQDREAAHLRTLWGSHNRQRADHADATGPNLSGLAIIGSALDSCRQSTEIHPRGHQRFGAISSFRLGQKTALALEQTDEIFPTPEMCRSLIPISGGRAFIAARNGECNNGGFRPPGGAACGPSADQLGDLPSLIDPEVEESLQIAGAGVFGCVLEVFCTRDPEAIILIVAL